ncbi:fibrillin-1-like isoform X3 [Hydra vulgaris]|uniref:fibrillin-1-like isoform X3 n=1 Tax=Hydra vulgaris TaxID=6087 RepID=UPI0032EA3C13
MKLFIKELFFLIHVVLILMILIDNVQGNIENLCNSNILLVKGKLIGEIQKLEKEFLVSFDVFPNKFVAGWHSVIHFTNGSNYGQYGDRVPGIWFHDNGAGGLHISAPINGNFNKVFTTKPIDLNHWSNVKVSQILKNSVYVYTIILNGEVVFTDINNQTQSFDNVKVYASDPWYDVQDGLIRNLFVINGISSNDFQPIIVLPTDIDECTNLTDYCNWANSDCANGNYYFTCKCVAYYSMNCNRENSDCLNTNQTIHFTCKPGWKLNNNSCVDINECTDSSKYCNWANSDCINTNGSYYCTCKSGWRLNEYSNSCIDIDECTNVTEYCNLPNSDCINTNGSYSCTCKFGWTLDEYNNSCRDIDECSSSSNICNTTSNVCVNSIGSYSCYKGEWSTWSECSETCGFGYKYSFLNTSLESQQEAKRSLPCMNMRCPDTNECKDSTKYCNWTNSDCIDTNESYYCTCKSGWRLNEYSNSCIDIDECANLTKYCNWPNSDCINTNGSYNCACKFGWTLDEYNNSCVDIDECSSSSNICNTTNNACVNSIGSYSCYKGEWSTWSECSETCGFGYKYSFLNTPLKSHQEIKKSLPCMNIKCPVDGIWSDWINYKSCLDSCGICFIKQERHCNNPPPTDDGHVCFGINVQYADSNSICRVNGGWTQWSSWSLCSQPCQVGVKKRYRSCTNPVPKYGGLQCNGNYSDESICYSNECKKVIVNFGMILSDIDYIIQYSSPLSEPYKELEKITIVMLQNLYNKFNKTVQCTLNFIKNEKDYLTKPSII